MFVENRPNRPNRSNSARRGVALLIVTIAIATLALGGATLLMLMRVEGDATAARERDALVKSVDRSAVVFLIGTIESTREERKKFGGVYNNPSRFRATPLLTPLDGGAATSRFTVVSPKFEKDKIEGVRYGLVDESTRLNLDAVLRWEEESPGAGRDALLKLPGMTRTAADSILDWIDADEDVRENGAEAKYYADKKLPYSPRNAVPVFLEELLLARDVTRLQLYGTDEEFTYGVENAAQTSDSSVGGSLSAPPSTRGSGGESDVVPWKELLTVFSAEKDVDPTGEARVDLNGADLSFLYDELAERVGEDVAKFVVLMRQYGPEEEIDPDADERPGATPEPVPTERLTAAELDFSRPATFEFETPLDLVGARVSTGEVAYESPIPDSRSKANGQKLFQLLDFASTSPSTTIVGRVNVNAAPRPVLAAIPGLKSADVQRILDERPDPSEELADDRRHASWLYLEGVVDLATMRKLYNKTTAFGDVYRGQIVGFLEGADATARADVVVDGTTEPPRQVFYKDLSTIGKGFSDAVLLGGSTSAADATGSLAGAASWDAVDAQTSGLFELEEPSESSGTTSAFGAVDRALNAVPGAFGGGAGTVGGIAGTETNAGGSTGIGTLGANGTESDADALGGGIGALDSTGIGSDVETGVGLSGTGLSGTAPTLAPAPTSASDSSSSVEPEFAGLAAATAVANGKSPETTNASAETPKARRQRFADALQSAREARRARNASNGAASGEEEESNGENRDKTDD